MIFRQNPSECLHKGEKLPSKNVQSPQSLLSPCHPFLRFPNSNPVMLRHSLFMPVLSLHTGVFLGYVLRDIMHCGCCSNCSRGNEGGWSETANQFFSFLFYLLVSPSFWLFLCEASGQDVSTDMSSAKRVLQNTCENHIVVVMWKPCISEKKTFQELTVHFWNSPIGFK